MATQKKPWISVTRSAKQWPYILLLSAAVLCIVSYILASLLMRPVGDDYDWLNKFYMNPDWLGSLIYMLQTNNGRYAQNLSVAIPYALLGPRIVFVTGFVSIGLFLLAAASAYRTVHRLLGKRTTIRDSLAVAAIIFLCYTCASATFPWVRGSMDNTFQGFLWYAGLVTYTLPFSLLILTVSVTYNSAYPRLHSHRKLFALLVTGTVLGLFNEVVLVAAMPPVMTFLAYRTISRRHIPIQKDLWPLYAVLTGLAIGLVIVYTSPASRYRRTLINTPAPTAQTIKQSFTQVPRYIDTYVLHKQEHRTLLLVPVVAGMAIAARRTPGFREKAHTAHDATRALLLSGGAAAAYLGVLFVCFLTIYKGYGLSSSTYLVPRFEILYNVWLVLCLGAAGYALARVMQTRLSARVLGTAIGAIMLALLPGIAVTNALRVKSVAVFSNTWDTQQLAAQSAKLEGAHSIALPTIDIGDSYSTNCGDKESWLREAKSQYYGMHICEP